jgi:TatD DNase family protein
MTNFIDLHCHPDHYLFQNDLRKVIHNAKFAGVKHILASGISPASNRFVLLLAKKYPGTVKASIGLYPIDAMTREIEEEHGKGLKEFSVDEELKFIEKNKGPISAIGEIGLDYKNGSQIDEQKHLFSRLLELAAKIKKPVIIHSRKAEKDAIDMLEEHKQKNVILHCFSGDKKLVKKAAALGYYFTIPTHVVRSQQFQDIIRDVPLNQLFCETDSPYLSPFPNRRNEPAFVVESYRKIAEIKGMNIDEVGNNIYMNWQRVFE